MPRAMQFITTKLKRLIYYILYPFYGYLDARFRDIHTRLHTQDIQLKQILECTTHLRTGFRGLRQEVCADARVTTETTAYFDRKVDQILEKLEELEEDMLKDKQNNVAPKQPDER